MISASLRSWLLYRTPSKSLTHACVNITANLTKQTIYYVDSGGVHDGNALDTILWSMFTPALVKSLCIGPKQTVSSREEALTWQKMFSINSSCTIFIVRVGQSYGIYEALKFIIFDLHQ